MKLEIPFIGCLMVLLALQVYGPHPIGMSDNGDYVKTLGRVNIWAVEATQQRNWFTTDYNIDPARTWDSGQPTSEMLFVLAAANLAELVLPAGRFDLRILGTLHLAVFLLGAWLLFRATRGFPLLARIAAGLLLLFVLSDVEYTQYLNTPYMDAASIVFLPLVFGVMVNAACSNRRSWVWPVAFAASGALFLTSKVQHEACLAALLLFAAVWAWRFAQGLSRLLWLIAGVLLIAASAFMFEAMPQTYSADTIFNLLVIDLAPRYPEPSDVLADLSLPPSDEPFLDFGSAFANGSPTGDPVYRERLVSTVSMASLARYYLTHPAITASILNDKWVQYGPDICNGELAQMRKVDNSTPGARATKFYWWSNARACLMRKLPVYPAVMLVAAIAWSTFSLFKKRPNPFAPAMLSAAILSLTSFAVAALADASDNARHLLLFHVALDFCIVLAIVSALPQLTQRFTAKP